MAERHHAYRSLHALRSAFHSPGRYRALPELQRLPPIQQALLSALRLAAHHNRGEDGGYNPSNALRNLPAEPTALLSDAGAAPL